MTKYTSHPAILSILITMYWKRLFTVHIEKALAKELSIHTELKAYQDVFEMVKDALEISDVKV